MKFSIRHNTEQGLELVIIKDESNGTEVALLPGFGATLQAFRVARANGPAFNVINSYRDADELNRGMNRSFKGPKLSPFPCRIPDGKYEFEGREYQFKQLFSDGNAIHGLLYNKAFGLVEESADETSGSLAMEYLYKKDDAGYPFDYSCRVQYILHADSLLEVVTTVVNSGETPIPIADGWHPYFQLGGKVNDWLLQFHSTAIVEFDERLVPTGKLLFYDAFKGLKQLGDTFLDNCFTLKPDIVGAACEIRNPANGLSVSFFPDPSYPYLQIYTPPTRDSIAIENLSGAPDCFNNKMGLLILPPGHSQIFTVRYKVNVG
ncbi:MAG TPA: aldose 1-epimerase [Puia sp.]|nr:aldose 1-epimerase [Puia sp.]